MECDQQGIELERQYRRLFYPLRGWGHHKTINQLKNPGGEKNISPAGSKKEGSKMGKIECEKIEIELKYAKESDQNCDTVIDFNRKDAVKEFFKCVKDESKIISYGGDVILRIEYKNGKVSKRTLNTSESIDVSGSGIYFILSAEGNNLLYIGKAQNLLNRLKQHLIECPESTHSHIKDVHQYLLERKKNNDLLQIGYSVLETTNPKHNAIIEGYLIDYALSNKSDSFFEKCWNIRED